MKAIEVNGIVEQGGQLSLDEPITIKHGSRVRVIILIDELIDQNDLLDQHPEEIKSSLRKSLQQAKAGQRIPLAQVWEGIDV